MVVKAALYKASEKTHPTAAKCRIQGCPKDAFHQACISHQTRLRNALRATGIPLIEKALLKQRIANMRTAQAAYLELQKKALK